MVSNAGRVARILKPLSSNNRGYYDVCFSDKYKQKRTVIHRIVAEAFIPNPDSKPFVNHKDSNKRNNRCENLEWVTHGENMKHFYSTPDGKIVRNHLTKVRSKFRHSKESKAKMSTQKKQWWSERNSHKNLGL